jgi:hypothetical protein
MEIPRNDEDELTILLIRILASGKKSTKQIENALDVSIKEKYCPEELTRRLNKLRISGKIKGAVNKGKGCWEWWS